MNTSYSDYKKAIETVIIDEEEADKDKGNQHRRDAKADAEIIDVDAEADPQPRTMQTVLDRARKWLAAREVQRITNALSRSRRRASGFSQSTVYSTSSWADCNNIIPTNNYNNKRFCSSPSPNTLRTLQNSKDECILIEDEEFSSEDVMILESTGKGIATKLFNTYPPNNSPTRNFDIDTGDALETQTIGSLGSLPSTPSSTRFSPLSLPNTPSSSASKFLPSLSDSIPESESKDDVSLYSINRISAPPEYPTLSNADMWALPKAVFRGQIKFTSLPKEVDDLLVKLADVEIIGVDTEFVNRNRICTLQVATRTIALVIYIYDWTPSYRSEKLVELLSNHTVYKIGQGPQDELTMLCDQLGLTDGISSVIDLQILATSIAVPRFNLRELSARFLRLRLSKAEQVTDWRRLPLTSRQLNYAAVDAFVTRELFFPLIGKLTEFLEASKDSNPMTVARQAGAFMNIRSKGNSEADQTTLVVECLAGDGCALPRSISDPFWHKKGTTPENVLYFAVMQQCKKIRQFIHERHNCFQPEYLPYFLKLQYGHQWRAVVHLPHSHKSYISPSTYPSFADAMQEASLLALHDMKGHNHIDLPINNRTGYYTLFHQFLQRHKDELHYFLPTFNTVPANTVMKPTPTLAQPAPKIGINLRLTEQLPQFIQRRLVVRHQYDPNKNIELISPPVPNTLLGDLFLSREILYRLEETLSMKHN